MGVAVAAAGALGDKFADAGDERQGRIGLFGGIEFFFKLVRAEPQPCIATGLVIGDHAVVYEPGDADRASGISVLSAGQFQLDHDAGGQPASPRGGNWAVFVSFP